MEYDVLSQYSFEIAGFDFHPRQASANNLLGLEHKVDFEIQ